MSGTYPSDNFLYDFPLRLRHLDLGNIAPLPASSTPIPDNISTLLSLLSLHLVLLPLLLPLLHLLLRCEWIRSELPSPMSRCRGFFGEEGAPEGADGGWEDHCER